MVSSRVKKISDKELIKWGELVGKDIIVYLHLNGKIRLSNAQIEKLSTINAPTDKTMYQVLKICKLIRKVKEDANT